MTERKAKLLRTWQLLQELLRLCEEQREWLRMQTDSLDSVRDQTDTMSLQELPVLIGAVEVNTSYHSEECGWAYTSICKILATGLRFTISCFNKFSVDKLESYALKNT